MSASTAGRVGVFGASGSGKSAYVKRRIGKQKRVVIFDPLGEYGHIKGVTDVGIGPDHLDRVRVAMIKDWAKFRIAYVPPAGNEGRALSALCKLLMAAQEIGRKRGSPTPITLVVEEMNLSFPVHGGEAKAPGFAEICSRGRHYGIEVVGVSQRMAEVSTRFRGNLTETVILRQSHARDLQAASDALGGKKTDVQALKNLEFLHERAGQIVSGKIKF